MKNFLWLALAAAGRAAEPALSKCLTESGFLKKYMPGAKSGELDSSSLKEVGAGSYGTVFELSAAGRPLALKKIEKGNANAIKDLAEEVEAGQKLHGVRGIVQLYECIVGSKWAGIVMEKLHGTFFSICTQLVGMPFERKLGVYSLLVSYVDAINARGYIHNDIKPMNIMVTDAEISDLRFIDFGITCRIGALCLGGTREFSPPEKIARNLSIEGHYSIDTWGVLMTLVFTENRNEYSLLKRNMEAGCGKQLDSHGCYAMVMSSVRIMLGKTQPALREYILAALDFSPAKRPPAAKMFEDFKRMRIEALLDTNEALLSSLAR